MKKSWQTWIANAILRSNFPLGKSQKSQKEIHEIQKFQKIPTSQENSKPFQKISKIP